MGIELARQIGRLVASLTVMAAVIGTGLWGQSTDEKAGLQFEVASLKPTADLTAPGQINRPPGDRGYHGINMPLITYLCVAYQVRPTQISGPDWIMAEHFDLEAKAEKPSTVDELHVMLQHLLEERFHMKIRLEKRDQPGFALVVDKGEPKLKVHDAEDRVTGPILPGSGVHNAKNVTMTYFCFYLSQELDKTVVDKTGLDGHYDFEVEWGSDGRGMMMPMMPVPPGTSAVMTPPMEMREASVPSGPTIPDALRKQLGLRLDPVKVPVDHLVVEKIEKLTEN